MPFEIIDYSYTFHNIGGHNVMFHIANVDMSGGSSGTNYYGSLADNGAYVIQKEVVSGTDRTYTYSMGASNYSTAWTARTTETYVAYSASFTNQ